MFLDELPDDGPLEGASEEESLEVRPGCLMVGRRNPASLLQCNTYLRSFDGGGTTHLCIDPGSRQDRETVERNLRRELGDLEALHAFSVNHQDPDVVGNAPMLAEANPNISAVMTEEVWRLVQHLGLRPRRLHFLNAAHTKWITIGDHFRWQVVPTPFCHFRGATALYDPELKTLFSGDLFGGFNRLGMVRMWADESDWPGIAQFHQIYMPTREALRYAVRQIQALQPAVEVIAPQHGFVIEGDNVPLFLERMHELLVGLDLLAVELDAAYLSRYREVLARLLEVAGDIMGSGEVTSRLTATDDATPLDRFLRVTERGADLEREGYSAIAAVWSRLARREPLDVVNRLRETVLAACSELEVPIPPIGAGLDEGVADGGVGSDGISLE